MIFLSKSSRAEKENFGSVNKNKNSCSEPRLPRESKLVLITLVYYWVVWLWFFSVFSPMLKNLVLWVFNLFGPMDLVLGPSSTKSSCPILTPCIIFYTSKYSPNTNWYKFWIYLYKNPVAALPDLVICRHLGYFLSSWRPNFGLWRLGILATFWATF